MPVDIFCARNSVNGCLSLWCLVQGVTLLLTRYTCDKLQVTPENWMDDSNLSAANPI